MAIFEQPLIVSPTLQTGKRILRSPSNNTVTASVYSTTFMPDYALWPTIYKQEDPNWCRAGVIKTVLMYTSGSSPSQNTIISNCQATLPAIKDYINPRLPDDYYDYSYTAYNGDQDMFNLYLDADVRNYQPMIFAMKYTGNNSRGYWPFTTQGHYAICCGYLTWENNKYFIGDPYYFTDYVPSATANDGYHKRTWSELNGTITNSHGENNQHVVW